MDDTSHSPTYGPDISIEPSMLDPTARLYGKISLGEECSLWPYAVIRAEAHEVRRALRQHAGSRDDPYWFWYGHDDR